MLRKTVSDTEKIGLPTSGSGKVDVRGV